MWIICRKIVWTTMLLITEFIRKTFRIDLLCCVPCFVLLWTRRPDEIAGIAIWRGQRASNSGAGWSTSSRWPCTKINVSAGESWHSAHLQETRDMAPSPAVFPGSRALAAVTISLSTARLEITPNLLGSPKVHYSGVPLEAYLLTVARNAS